MKPFGIMSDSHNHNWSAFSTTLETGVNSRLGATLDETLRCGREVLEAGGNTMIHAGDLFHVRGSIAPSVLNPTLDTYKALIKSGLNIVIVAGNHDLENKHSNRLGNAVTALENVGCKIISSAEDGMSFHDDIVAIPWIQNVDELKATILKARDTRHDHKDIDLIIHAPVDGVISGLPDHGLTDTWLAGLGFRRVFSGHYHHHKDFGNGVYSIGALCHNSWSDVGSKAGFLIVDDATVNWRASRAPSFVEISAETDKDEIELLVDGNYVRAKIKTAKQSDIEESRQYLTDCGAKGVVLIAEKEVVVSKRTGATVKSGASLEESVGEFIKAQEYPNQSELSDLCGQILAEAKGE